MRFAFIAAGLLALASPAMSATINYKSFSAGAYNTAVGGFSNAVVEDFESFSEGNVANGFTTSVGTFSTLGGTGTGGTVSGADFANDGSKLAVRDGNVYGRRSTTSALSGNSGDNMFLDSNDTYGIRWDVSLGGNLFDRLVLTLSDATDVGATMRISVGGAVLNLNGLANGNRQIIAIDFGAAVSSASIFFGNYSNGKYRLNDGFSIDDIAVNEVPLPASALLLLAGLGGMTALRRRKG